MGGAAPPLTGRLRAVAKTIAVGAVGNIVEWYDWGAYALMAAVFAKQIFPAHDALTSLIREDATQSMPPYDLWLRGRDDIFKWWLGPGIGCRGSRVIPVSAANGSPAFGQYKPSETGEGFDPWALQVLELSEGQIVELTFFLGTATLFPLFGLPLHLDS